MPEKKRFVVISTTVDSEAVAGKLAGRIVEARLAACVQYTSVHSVYRWKGAVESAGEYLLLAKTRASLANELVAFIRKVHSYEVPEVIVTPITGGLETYLHWIEEETKGQGSDSKGRRIPGKKGKP